MQLNGVSLQQLTGVSTRFCLEPPLHLLGCLCDCRILQQQQQQKHLWRYSSSSSSNSSSRWFVGYATSRQLAATGAARGLRDPLSNFRRCSSSSSSSSSDPLEQQQQEQLQQQRALLPHPLYGVSDAACCLCIEVKKQLTAGSSSNCLSAAVLSLWGVCTNKPLSSSSSSSSSNKNKTSSKSESSSSSSNNSKLQQDKPQQLSAAAAAFARLSRDEFLDTQRAVAAAVAR